MNACRDLRSRVSLVVASLSLAILARPAHAVDLAVPGTGGNPQISIDSTWSANTLGVRYADVNLTMSPFGSIYENGVRLRLSGSWVGYNFVSNTDPWTLSSGSVLEGNWQVGYGINTDRLSVIALAGLAVDDSQNAGVHSSRTGFSAALSTAARPTDMTYLYASVQYSTISHGYLAQGKVGLKAFGTSYVGIEGSCSGLIANERSLVSQRIVGAHISNVKIGPAFLSLSAGYVYEDQLAGGAYATAAFYVAF